MKVEKGRILYPTSFCQLHCDPSNPPAHRCTPVPEHREPIRKSAVSMHELRVLLRNPGEKRSPGEIETSLRVILWTHAIRCFEEVLLRSKKPKALLMGGRRFAKVRQNEGFLCRCIAFQ